MSHVTLIDYDAGWPAHFRQVASQLEGLFAPGSVRFEHIGSTSVVGLCAKPVIDLMLGVPDLDVVESRIPAIEWLGYTYRREHESELPHRRYFVRPSSGGPRIHLHALVHGSLSWRQHLVFRDALRADPTLLSEYASLKRALAARHACNKSAYTEAKGPFIRRVLNERAGVETAI